MKRGEKADKAVGWKADTEGPIWNVRIVEGYATGLIILVPLTSKIFFWVCESRSINNLVVELSSLAKCVLIVPAN